MNLKGLSLRSLAVTISDFLKTNGVDTVLTGGACVSIYTQNRFMSFDLDFVLLSDDDQREVKRLLAEIGFYLKNQCFKHDDVEFVLEFISPPLSVGNEPVKEIMEIKEGNKILTILSPTDCVKDRLAAFYHWNDRPSLIQAVMVCTDNHVNLKEVERWSRKEGMKDKFREFLKALEASYQGTHE